MADPVLLLTIFIVAVALAFDYVNGFHDAANSIATVVSTRVLTPMQGVVWAAFWNFVAAFTFGTAVAKTIGSGLLDVKQVDSYVILAGLIGAIAWDLITWYVGLPTSSSHALIGGYAGAGIAKAGLGVIIPGGWISTLTFIVIAPLMGMALGMINLVAILNIFKRSIPANVDHIFQTRPADLGRRLQSRPRHQRRAKNHGHHRRRSLHRARLSRSGQRCQRASCSSRFGSS